jgi:hypothetical protein
MMAANVPPVNRVSVLMHWVLAPLLHHRQPLIVLSMKLQLPIARFANMDIYLPPIKNAID